MAHRRTDGAVLGAVGLAHLLRHPRLARRVWSQIGHRPRLGAPQEYLELLLWRKVVDRNPRFVTYCDKLLAKDVIVRRCPDLAVPPTLWVGDDLADAPVDVLAGDVWVKANHGFGWNVPLRPGEPHDLEALRARTAGWLRARHGREHHEWAYRHVRPRLFVEASVGDPDGDELVELEVRAGGGAVVHGSVVGHNKRPGEWRVFLDAEGGPLTADEAAGVEGLAPGVLDAYRRAVAHSEVLSIDVDYARFDFFVVGGALFGGEITVYPAGGTDDLPPHRGRQIADAWDLRRSHAVAGPQTGWRRVYAGALRRRLDAERGEVVRGAATTAP